MSANLTVDNSNNYQLVSEATAADPTTAPAAPTQSGFDFDCNVFAILTQALSDLSNSDMALASVQSQGILQNTEVESGLSQASETQLNQIENSMNTIINNGKWTDSKGKSHTLNSQTCQDHMSLLNTEFSTDMQEGNMNVQMVQANLQNQESESQMSMDALKNSSQLFNLSSQIYSFISNLIASSPL
ncbi:MAG: hypothetical protein JSR39_02215 [Verrucomicrobia bacterium]|nr:hypothetical protein [Verrucomicrobiota bacterium]